MRWEGTDHPLGVRPCTIRRRMPSPSGSRLRGWFALLDATDLIRAMAGAAKGRGARELATIRRPGYTLAARVMSRSLGPVSVRIEDGLATVTCSLDGSRVEVRPGPGSRW